MTFINFTATDLWYDAGSSPFFNKMLDELATSNVDAYGYAKGARDEDGFYTANEWLIDMYEIDAHYAATSGRPTISEVH